MQEMPKSARSVIKIDLRKVAAFFAMIVAVVLVDQLSKWVVVKSMTLGESIPVIKDFFHFTYILNKGAAFGMLADNRWVFLLLSTLSIAVLAVAIILMSGKLSWRYGICFSMIVGGGIGNMIDRIFNGETIGSGAVIDFIDFRGIWSYIFNVADSFVCVGAALFFLFVVIEEVMEIKKSRAQKATLSENNDPAETSDRSESECGQSSDSAENGEK